MKISIYLIEIKSFQITLKSVLNEITFQSPTWYIFLCIALGLIVSMGLYFRDKKLTEAPTWSKYLMAILRFLTVTSIAFLLMSPFVKSTLEEAKEPIVVIAEDSSKSITANLSEDEIEQQKQKINTIADQLRVKYEVKRISFGDKVTTNAVDSFTSEVTNLSEAFNYISDNFGDQNLGALIMSTDGIYNEGKNPLYDNLNIQAPLYFIAQGDTSIRKDLLIKNVFNNSIAYLDDQFSIQIDLSAYNSGGNNTLLSVSKIDGNSKREYSENISINSDNFFTTKEIVLNANKVGLNRYRIAVSPINGEVSNANNYKDIYIEVLDARQKILLYANAPHPDLSALKSLITQNKNYEVEIHYPEDQDVNISDFDLVVFHNLPSSKFNIRTELAKLNQRQTPRLFIVGAQTQLQAFNNVQENISIAGNGNSLEDVQASLDPSFTSFTTASVNNNILRNFPPLTAPFGQYKNTSGAKVLLEQIIKKIDTDYPLLSFSDQNGIKTGVFVGEGIWRWRLFNYLQNNNYDIVSEVVNKSVQFLTTKEDKRKFKVNSIKNLYKENEQIYFDAQLFNDNYELVNEPDVQLTIINEENKEYNYTFSRSNSYYTLNAGMLPPGKYNYVAQTNFDGVKYDDKGFFTIQNIQLELYNLTANHTLLAALSDKYGGQVFMPDNSIAVSDIILSNENIKPVIYQTTKTKSLINFKWLFD